MSDLEDLDAAPEQPSESELKKLAAEKDVTMGLIWTIGGIGATVIGYQVVSDGGGSYVVFTGAIAYGLVRLFRGMMAHDSTVDSLVRKSLDAESTANPTALAVHATNESDESNESDDVEDPYVVLPAAEQIIDAPRSEVTGRAARLLKTTEKTASIGYLVEELSKKPDGWRPRTTTPSVLRVACWNEEEFAYANSESHTSTNGPIKIVWVKPSYSKVGYLLALSAFEREDWPTAETCLDRALELEPDHPLLWCARGVAHEGMKQPRLALSCYRRGSSVRPHDTKATQIAYDFESSLLAHQKSQP